MAIVVFGANFTLWGLIGLIRLLDGWRGSLLRGRRSRASVAELSTQRRKRRPAVQASRVRIRDVAVLMAAHNEELVITESLRAITALVPARNVHVVSDGSTDRTEQLAAAAGVNVVATEGNLGKAGALQVGIKHFDLVRRFRVVMLLDADTRVERGYFHAALPLFDDPGVVAVAGCVRTSWRDRELSPAGRLVAFHRQRIYSMTQYLLKFGQTWRRLNATHIVPGFASLYRTDVLPSIEVNPPGLVIEDFNMTFEVYQKRLGKVGFTPSAIAATQDPGRLRDYVRQSKRWSLGLWQTVHRHPPRLNLFTGMLALLLLELLTSSMMLVLLPVAVLLLAVPVIPGALALPWLAAAHGLVAGFLTFPALLLGIVLPDLLLTLIVTVMQRQPRFLLFAPLYLPLRVLDSGIALYALALAWRNRSTGRWRSPQRRSVAGAPDQPGAQAG